MRRAVVLGSVMLVALVSTLALARQTPPVEPVGPIQKIRNNLFVISGQGGNTAVFVTRTGVVLVDTKLAGNGQAILDRVAAVSDLPVTTIINTHAHGDHVGGNEFFPGAVDVVTHENTRRMMLEDPSLAGKPEAIPDRTFEAALTIGRGPDRVELHHFGRGHTSGDTVVVFPSVRAMHAGDLFPWRAAPLIDQSAGGSGVAYPETLESVLRGVRDVDVVIPGHMPVATWAAFAEFVEFNRAILTAVQAARAAGRTREQATAGLSLPAKFDAYVMDRPLPGLEFLGTAAGRAQVNAGLIFDELR